MSQFANMAFVALGGAVGCCLRYSVGHLAGISAIKGLSTFMVNVLGCFIIGILYSVFSRWNTADCWRLMLFIGLLGGFTTFSSYALDAVTMCQSGEIAKAAGYLLLTNIIGVFAAFAGVYGTNWLIKAVAS